MWKYEEIVLNIQLGNEVAVYDHPNTKKYPNQKPYQTFVSSILHKFIDGKLVEKSTNK
jgi:hypothetical protein